MVLRPAAENRSCAGHDGREGKLSSPRSVRPTPPLIVRDPKSDSPSTIGSSCLRRAYIEQLCRAALRNRRDTSMPQHSDLTSARVALLRDDAAIAMGAYLALGTASRSTTTRAYAVVAHRRSSRAGSNSISSTSRVTANTTQGVLADLARAPGGRRHRDADRRRQGPAVRRPPSCDPASASRDRAADPAA
jgi:hypothetical protein